MWQHTSLSLLFVGCFGCGSDNSVFELANAPEDEAPSESALAVLGLVNDPLVGVEELDHGARLDTRAATNIVGRRDGVDRIAGTADDRPFETLEALDAVPYVGMAALARLYDYAMAHGYLSSYAPPPLEIPERDDVLFDEEVLRAVLAEARITDAAAVLTRAALRYDDGDRVLDHEELSLAAASCRVDIYAIEGYSFAESVVVRIMEAFELQDRLALLAAAVPYDQDQNRYLSQREIERARLVVTAATE